MVKKKRKGVRYVIETTEGKRGWGYYGTSTLNRARDIVLKSKAVGSKVRITKFTNGKRQRISKEQLGGITPTAIRRMKRHIVQRRRPL